MLAIASATSLALTACGGSAERSAAPEETPGESVSESAAGLDGGGNLGTRVCVYNEDAPPLQVKFSRADSVNGPSDLKMGDQICGEGTRFAGSDVLGEIKVDSTLTMYLWGNNPWAGSPGAGVGQVGASTCAGRDGFDVNMVDTWDDGVLLYTIKRLPDGAWKEFEIKISKSPKPSADGKYERCASRGGAITA
jgi:hypothetical protein